MPAKVFGLDILNRLPSPQEKPRPNKTSPKASAVEGRRGSMDSLNLKRPSFPGLAKKIRSNEGKSRSPSGSQTRSREQSRDKLGKEQHAPVLPKPVKLGMYMESPPVLFIGTTQQSTGAIITGRLQVTANVPEAIVEWVHMYLECNTTTKRPVSDRCRECMTKVDQLTEWKFLTKPTSFRAQHGMTEIPFTYLVPGNLPATTHGSIGSLDYSLHVRAKTSSGQEVEFRREVIFQRAIPPGAEKNSIRVFPPTNLQLHVTIPNIVHPLGEFPVQCRMTGITTKQKDAETRWRLRKLTWRVEENETMISPACTKHASKVGGEGKGVQHESMREVAMEELKWGWKTDFAKGEIEGEFNASIDAAMKPQCNVEAQNGLKITHNLILECVIAEEWQSAKKSNSNPTPTGAARVLRTQFALNVTERAGMGLSWDDEMPPMYDSVPESPPHYLNESPPQYPEEHTRMVDYEGDDLHEDVEQLNLNS